MKTARTLFITLLITTSLTTFSQLRPTVQTAKHFRVTPPLRDMVKIKPGLRDRSWKDNIIRNEIRTDRNPLGMPAGWKDPLLQSEMGRTTLTQIIENFEGLGNLNGVLPPDTDGDIGPNHYFQMINLSFAIFDKNGNILYGPFDNSTLWDGFIGPWTGTNDGDPIVLYDELADRWMASQFAVNTSNGTYWELIAVSVTSDPAGAYYQYAFEFPVFNDYPKFGLWPDAYYASFNMFGSYNRVAAAAFERDSLLVGAPGARMVLFDLPSGSDPWSMLPSDFDGTPPPAGTPNFFMYFNDYLSNDELRIWEFAVDWNTPANSTFAETSILYPSEFDSEICPATRGRCIPQPGTTAQLETLSDRLMYRLQYRNMGGYEAMVVNHTVDVGGGLAGIRWYEFRDSGSGWSIYQEGTYSPDADHRWMGSIAMDAAGNIGLGYSVSSDTTYPSIRYTGRLSGDPLGAMTFTESEIVAGGGSQTYTSAPRWGDYASMSVDPSDDSTFWFTTEYMQTSSSAGWKTRIASFKLAPSAPVADFIADNTSVSPNSIVNFTDLSSFIPTAWQWTFPGGTPTSSSLQDPSVTYSESGYYDVTLKVTNALGSSIISKANYIRIPSASDTLFYDDFEASTGWTLLDEFQIDQPAGLGGSSGNPDPSNAYQGSQVLGVDLTGINPNAGDYERNLTDRECRAESPIIDCSGYDQVILSFMRWLNVETSAYDSAHIDVFDGASWHPVWYNPGEVADNSWVYQEFDISYWVAGNNGVKIRFAIGETDRFVNYSGWNIDSLSVLGFSVPDIQNVSWTGEQDGNWNNAGNWSSAVMPSATSRVLIPSSIPGVHEPVNFSQPYNEIDRIMIEQGVNLNISTGDSLIIINDGGN